MPDDHKILRAWAAIVRTGKFRKKYICNKNSGEANVENGYSWKRESHNVIGGVGSAASWHLSVSAGLQVPSSRPCSGLASSGFYFHESMTPPETTSEVLVLQPH